MTSGHRSLNQLSLANHIWSYIRGLLVATFMQVRQMLSVTSNGHSRKLHSLASFYVRDHRLGSFSASSPGFRDSIHDLLRSFPDPPRVAKLGVGNHATSSCGLDVNSPWGNAFWGDRGTRH